MGSLQVLFDDLVDQPSHRHLLRASAIKVELDGLLDALDGLLDDEIADTTVIRRHLMVHPTDFRVRLKDFR